jgi:hypothetical protein
MSVCRQPRLARLAIDLLRFVLVLARPFVALLNAPALGSRIAPHLPSMRCRGFEGTSEDKVGPMKREVAAVLGVLGRHRPTSNLDPEIFAPSFLVRPVPKLPG